MCCAQVYTGPDSQVCLNTRVHACPGKPVTRRPRESSRGSLWLSPGAEGPRGSDSCGQKVCFETRAKVSRAQTLTPSQAHQTPPAGTPYTAAGAAAPSRACPGRWGH